MTAPAVSAYAGAQPGTITRAQLRLVNDVLVATVEVTTAAGTYPAPDVALDNWHPTPDGIGRRVGTAYGCEVIRQLMVAAGVRRWDHLIGCKVRIFLDRDRTAVAAIHHDRDNALAWDVAEIAGRM